MSEMIGLRPATIGDIATLWPLRTRAVAHGCTEHYAPEVMATWLAASPSPALEQHIGAGGGQVAIEDGVILGYAVLDPASGEVEAVFVDPAQEGRGVGRRLLDALASQARAAGHDRLYFSASLNAVPFYQRAGFVAVREELYPHRSGIGIPSVFMEKPLG